MCSITGGTMSESSRLYCQGQEQLFFFFTYLYIIYCQYFILSILFFQNNLLEYTKTNNTHPYPNKFENSFPNKPENEQNKTNFHF